MRLQLVRGLADSDLTGTRALLDELERDAQQALDETARLAQAIQPPLREARDLGAALRVAAASRGVAVSVEVGVRGECAPETLSTVYFCCLEVIDHAGEGVTITVGEAEGALAFEITTGRSGDDVGLVGLRDRVEALGGRLAIEAKPGGGTRVAGSLPLPR
jgi:signal transduction histidine kinase